MKYAIALDIGGTSIKYTLVNQNGDILYESSETTQSKENPRPLSDIIKSIVRKMTDYARSRDWGIYGIGIGVPSVVDKGVVLFANNLPELDNQQLDLALAEFNLPVFIDNDANLMGLGEVIYGAAKGLSDIVFLTVGTGIGGALFLNGRLYGGYLGCRYAVLYASPERRYDHEPSRWYHGDRYGPTWRRWRWTETVGIRR